MHIHLYSKSTDEIARARLKPMEEIEECKQVIDFYCIDIELPM